ncbi:MFS transporter [Geomonas silvestris]|uniref:MFS transporter n=1 Tax=Geomonas silvestris TaxID=2740184 RepID=A0A6V8MHQ1_9BACT|nr:DHA2 family efflux MFS transporter permease subunit [Geomonas silvestris]GFO59189.1 MFS transporter [Geomonas silvestris]
MTATCTVTDAESSAPLSGGLLWLAALMLASANFIAVLNMTIANVSVPNIAGNLGATTSQGTWVITSYAVGEAITVPLTGWLAARFGSVRVFVGSMALFGIFSALCGLSNSLGLLVVARIFQGFSGGPLMPLSQTLLLRIFPKEKTAAAIGLWSMTTLVAPVVGPIMGGYLCDEFSWPWVFFLNAPIAAAAAFFSWQLLKRYTEPLSANRIDLVGLGLLVVWVAALQLVLDEGKDLDWFASSKIVALSVVAAVGFIAFLIWEFHEAHPVVDLRVFRHRGFSVSVLTISLAFAAFFGVSVLTPLWLQSFMGYTATISGLATAWSGITSIFLAPIAAQGSMKWDPRKLVFGGVLGLGAVTLWRAVATTDMGFWNISIPLMFMGLFMPFFFIPTTGLALASVEEHEMDSAAGLMNFLRTLSGAFATSLVTTSWSNRITENHAELVGLADSDASVRAMLEASGAPPEVTNELLDYLVTGQSVMLATNQLMWIIGIAFVVAASVIWLAPRPSRVVDPSAGGH